MNFSKLKNFMDYMAAERTPGNAVVVYLDGKPVFDYACGVSDLTKQTPLTGKEFFNIYSCSKITTVTAGMQLVEQGKMLLTDPLYEYIPEFYHMNIKYPDGTFAEAKNPITVGDLFSMTAGFTYDFDTPGFERARIVTKGHMDTVETIKCIASDPLSFEPGTHWQYSICHDVLAALVSVISGKKFRDYVKESIFDPLEMTESFYHLTDEIRERMATQYRFMPADGTNMDIVEAQRCGNSKEGYFQEISKERAHVLGDEYDSGGAGIVTTVWDYAKLINALANYGAAPSGERILSKAAVNLMRTDRLTPEQRIDYNWKQLRGCGYGLGVRTHIAPEKSGVMSRLGEFGWGGAAGATAIIDPEIRLGVFYVQHTLNPREEYYQPRLRNVVYGCLE